MDMSGIAHASCQLTRVRNASSGSANGWPRNRTKYGYDLNGNQTSIGAPLSRTTGATYDELNRLKQITDAASGITQFSYDATDNLTSLTDPRTLTTSYAYNGFGDLVTQTSPDTGTTTNTYDSAGNLATSTDARGAVATYTYDVLNRTTSIAYSLGGVTDQTIAFTYDSGVNGKGHLTGASDAAHSMSWGYDALGRITSKTQTVGTVAHTMSYGYTNADLTSLTTPSGQSIGYGYNANHQVTSVSVNGTSVLTNATYEPLGPIDGWTWGNGTTTVRAYDADGNVSVVNSGGEANSYGYDDAGRITSMTNAANGNLSWTYGYDVMDRVNTANSIPWQETFTFDADGNRLTQGGSYSATFSYSPTSNRITSSNYEYGTPGYDASGNVISVNGVTSGAGTAGYNAAGRVTLIQDASLGLSMTFQYNALGQRIRKTSPYGNTTFVYDEAGHLLGEYDDSGNLIEEMVWLADTPVATLRPNGSGSVAIYYVHSDHLNSPRKITRPSDNAVVWRWDSDPFGNVAPNENPSGLGTFVSNLAFPGQYIDEETALFYNGARYYDAGSSRYFQSDPIGLGGGINTYAYAYGNPISITDPLGLWGLFGFGSVEASGPSASPVRVGAEGVALGGYDSHHGWYAGVIGALGHELGGTQNYYAHYTGVEKTVGTGCDNGAKPIDLKYLSLGPEIFELLGLGGGVGVYHTNGETGLFFYGSGSAIGEHGSVGFGFPISYR